MKSSNTTYLNNTINVQNIARDNRQYQVICLNNLVNSLQSNMYYLQNVIKSNNKTVNNFTYNIHPKDTNTKNIIKTECLNQIFFVKGAVYKIYYQL